MDIGQHRQLHAETMPSPRRCYGRLRVCFVSLKSVLRWRNADNGWNRPILLWSEVAARERGRPVRLPKNPNSCQGHHRVSPNPQGWAELDNPDAPVGACLSKRRGSVSMSAGLVLM